MRFVKQYNPVNWFGPILRIVNMWILRWWTIDCSGGSLHFLIFIYYQFLVSYTLTSSPYWASNIHPPMQYLKHTHYMNLRHRTHRIWGLWAGDPSTGKSTSGYLFQLSKSPISWPGQKQISVALSSTEAEYILIFYSCYKVIWLWQLPEDLRGPVSQSPDLYEDNKRYIKPANSEKIKAKTKHIDVGYHYFWDLVPSPTITTTSSLKLGASPSCCSSLHYLKS